MGTIEYEGRKLHLIKENLAVTSDGSMNIIVMERYEKQDGKGKNAVKTGEYGWRNLNGGSYCSNLDSLGFLLMRPDVIETVGEVGIDFEPFKEYLDGKLKEYQDFVKGHFELVLGKVKDLSDSEDKPVTTSKVKIKK